MILPSQPLNIGVIGATGYAAGLMQHLDQLISRDRARLAAVEVSMAAPSEPTAEILQRHGATQVRGIDELVHFPGLDAVIIATSIDSHLAYTQTALSAGLHVHCEKPAAATVQDVRRMIEARDRANKTVLIGYQDTFAPSVQWAKQRILDEDIGDVQRVRLWACWPRPDSYYRRNDWAGRLKRGDQWVLDSPAHNALAHQINLALYVTGLSFHESNRATSVEAELYRARDITNYDTCALRCDTSAGPQLLILLTHACCQLHDPVVEFLGPRGSIRRIHPGRCELLRDGNVVASCDDGPRGAHGCMFDNFLDCIEGRAKHPMCRIENALQVARLVNGASAASPVHPVDPAHISCSSPSGPGPLGGSWEGVPVNIARASEDTLRAIRDVESVFRKCFEQFKLPHELGGVPWAHPAGHLDLKNYEHFGGPCHAV